MAWFYVPHLTTFWQEIPSPFHQACGRRRQTAYLDYTGGSKALSVSETNIFKDWMESKKPVAFLLFGIGFGDQFFLLYFSSLPWDKYIFIIDDN